MKRAFLAVAFSALVLATQASAITGGQLDGDGHPNAGAWVYYDPNGLSLLSQQFGPGPIFLCSIVLVHERVALTAGHCIANVQSYIDAGLADEADIPRVLFVTFNPDAFAVSDYRPVARFEGIDTATTNKDTRKVIDIGAIVLANAVTDIAPAVLPSPGLLASTPRAELRADQYEVVGYGSTGGANSKDPALGATDGQRRVGTSLQFLNILDNLVLFQENNQAGHSGACFGDSGGPTFLVDATTGTETLIAETVDVYSSVCKSVGVQFRLDIPESLAFVQSVVDSL